MMTTANPLEKLIWIKYVKMWKKKSPVLKMVAHESVSITYSENCGIQNNVSLKITF